MAKTKSERLASKAIRLQRATTMLRRLTDMLDRQGGWMKPEDQATLREARALTNDLEGRKA